MSDFVEATPWNGGVVHAIHAKALEQWSNSERWVLSRALCGVRGRDAGAMGGMIPRKDAAGQPVPFTATDANPTGRTSWDGKQLNAWCPRCIGRVRRLRKAAEDEVDRG